MHSFLSKVFGRKKEDKSTSPTTLAPGELLDGKFEAISPNVSPSANNFLELDTNGNGHDAKNKGKEVGFSKIFRAKSRPSSPEVNHKKLDTLPHLSLNFRETREEVARELGFLLDVDSDTHDLLSDAIIGQRRLNPLEALVLIQACSKAITSRGLETLGIMHPHWYSSSADVQHRLISHFLQSLAAPSSPDAGSPVSLTSPASLFESELNFTRSPHDIAAVLRWGLRHFEIEGDSFGTDEGWYNSFLDAEAAAQYPPKSFSEQLAPILPPAHLDLLTATLEIFSSLAAHAEANSTSGSKLCKMFGLWLLAARRVEDRDDWVTFYARWERTGRMLEHLFLARIRDENTDLRMPVRLLELVRKYPYTKGISSPTTDLRLLPRPRFSTPSYDALFVRIEIEFPKEGLKPKSRMHPLNLLADAFSAQVTEGEFAELWTKITAASRNGSNPSPLSNIFADETIRFLSIIPDERAAKSQDVKSPTFSLAPVSPLKRAFSESAQDQPVASTSQHRQVSSEPAPVTPVSPLAIGSDWVQFSSSGFLDSTPAIAPLVSTLFDTDLEKTVPPAPLSISRKSSRRLRSPRKSIDAPRVSIAEDGVKDPEAPVPALDIKPVVKASKLDIIQFDEAFIDFWSDSLLDPITTSWPTFIICKFKSTLVPTLLYGPIVEGQAQKTLKWLVLEQAYTVRPPPPPPSPPVAAAVAASANVPADTARPVSPSPSTKKRFNFFTRSISGSSIGSLKGKKKEKALQVGEMGELVEEDHAHDFKVETEATTPVQSAESVEQEQDLPEALSTEQDHTQAVVATATVAVIAAGTVAVAVVASEDNPTEAVFAAEEIAAPVDEIAAAPVQEEASPAQLVVEEKSAPALDSTVEVAPVEEDDVPLTESAIEKEPTAEPASDAVAEVPAVETAIVPEAEVIAEEAAPEPTNDASAEVVGPADEVSPVVEDVVPQTESAVEVESAAVPVDEPVSEAPAVEPTPTPEAEVAVVEAIIATEVATEAPDPVQGEAETIAEVAVPEAANDIVADIVEPAQDEAAALQTDDEVPAPTLEDVSAQAEAAIVDAPVTTPTSDAPDVEVAPIEEEKLADEPVVAASVVAVPQDTVEVAPVVEEDTKIDIFALEEPVSVEAAVEEETAVAEENIVVASVEEVGTTPVEEDVSAKAPVADAALVPEPEQLVEAIPLPEESTANEIVAVEEAAVAPDVSAVDEHSDAALVSDAAAAVPESQAVVETVNDEVNEAPAVDPTILADDEESTILLAPGILGLAALAVASADRAKVAEEEAAATIQGEREAVEAPVAEAVAAVAPTEESVTEQDEYFVADEAAVPVAEDIAVEKEDVISGDEEVSKAADEHFPVDEDSDVVGQGEGEEVQASVVEIATDALAEVEGAIEPPADSTIHQEASTPVEEVVVEENAWGEDVDLPHTEEVVEVPVGEAAAEDTLPEKEDGIASHEDDVEVTVEDTEVAFAEKENEIALTEEPVAEDAAYAAPVETEATIIPQSASTTKEDATLVAEAAGEVDSVEDGDSPPVVEGLVAVPVPESAVGGALIDQENEIVPRGEDENTAADATPAWIQEPAGEVAPEGEGIFQNEPDEVAVPVAVEGAILEKEDAAGDDIAHRDDEGIAPVTESVSEAAGAVESEFVVGRLEDEAPAEVAIESAPLQIEDEFLPTDAEADHKIAPIQDEIVLEQAVDEGAQTEIAAHEVEVEEESTPDSSATVADAAPVEEESYHQNEAVDEQEGAVPVSEIATDVILPVEAVGNLVKEKTPEISTETEVAPKDEPSVETIAVDEATELPVEIEAAFEINVADIVEENSTAVEPKEEIAERAVEDESSKMEQLVVEPQMATESSEVGSEIIQGPTPGDALDEMTADSLPITAVENANEDSAHFSRQFDVESEHGPTSSAPASQIADSGQGNIDPSAEPAVDAIGQVAIEIVDGEAQIQDSLPQPIAEDVQKPVVEENMQAVDNDAVNESNIDLAPSSESIIAEYEATTLRDTEDLPADAGQVDEPKEVEETRFPNADHADVEAVKEVTIVEEVGDEDIASDPHVPILAAADEPVEDATEKGSYPNLSGPTQVIEQPAIVDDAVIADTPEKPDAVVEEPTVANDAAILSAAEEPGSTEQPIGEESAPIEEPVEIVEEPIVLDDAPTAYEPVVAEGPIAEEPAPILETAEVISEATTIDDPVILTTVEEPVEAPVATVEVPDIAHNLIEEAPVSTPEPSVTVIEEPAIEEVSSGDIAVGPPADDPLVPISVEGQVQGPIEEVVESALIPVQPVAAVKEPVAIEAITDAVNVAAVSAHEPLILAATEDSNKGSAELSDPVSEETIEIIEEPVIADIPAASQGPVVAEYPTEEVLAKSPPVLEEPVQSLEDPVVAEDVTETEAGGAVEATPAAEDPLVSEETIDDTAVQSPLISQDPVQEAVVALEDSINNAEVVNDDVLESEPVQFEESVVVGDVIESTPADLTPVKDLEEVVPVGIEEPTSTRDDDIADVPADSTHESADAAEDHTPASTAETSMNDAEVAADESAPDQEDLSPHVDEVLPVVEMGAEDVLVVPPQDFVNIPIEAPATVAEVSSEVSDHAALAEEGPIPPVSVKSLVSAHESVTDETKLASDQEGQTFVANEGALTNEDSFVALNDPVTIEGNLPADVEDVKAETIVEDHPVELTRVLEDDILQPVIADAGVVEAQSIEPAVPSKDPVIADDSIEEGSVPVPEQPVEIDDGPIIEEEVAIDDVVAPPVHESPVPTAIQVPIDNPNEEAVIEPTPIAEPTVEAADESVTEDAVVNDVAEEPPTRDHFILGATGETANDSAEQSAIIPAEAVEATEEPAEDPAIPAGPEEDIVAEHPTEEVVADPVTTSEEPVSVLEKLADAREDIGNDAIDDEPIAAAPPTEEPTIAEETADDKTASASVAPVQAIEEVAISQEDTIKSEFVYDEIVPTIAEEPAAKEVPVSSSTDVREDPEESALPASTEEGVFAEVPVMQESIPASEEHVITPVEAPVNTAEVAPADFSLDQEASPLLEETQAAAAEDESATLQPQYIVDNATETPVTVEVNAEVLNKSFEPASVLEDVAPPAVIEQADESTLEKPLTDSTAVQDEQTPGASEEPAVNGQEIGDFVIPIIQQDGVPPATDEVLVSEANVALDHPAAAHNEDNITLTTPEDPISTGEETSDKQPIEPTPVYEEPIVQTSEEPAAVNENVEEVASLAAEETPVPETDATPDHVISQHLEPSPVIEDTAKGLDLEQVPVQEELETTAIEEPVPATEVIEDTVAPSVEEPAVSEPETIDPVVESAPSHEPEFNAVEEKSEPADIPSEVEVPIPENLVSASEIIAAANTPSAEEPIVSEAEMVVDHTVDSAHFRESEIVADPAVVQEEVEQSTVQEPLPVTEHLEEAVTPIAENPPVSEPGITAEIVEEAAAPATEEAFVSRTVISEDDIAESTPRDPDSVVNEVAKESEPTHVEEEVESHVVEEPVSVIETVVAVAEPLVSEADIAVGEVVESAPQELDAVADEVAHELELAAVHGELKPVPIEEPVSVAEQVEEQLLVPIAEETLVAEPASAAVDATPAQDSAAVVPEESSSSGEEYVGEQSLEPTPSDAEIPLAAHEPISASEEVVDDLSGELAPAGDQHVPAIDEDTADVVVEEAEPISDVSRATEELEISDAAVATDIPSESLASPIDESPVPVEPAAVESMPIEPESAPLESADPATLEVPQAETPPTVEGSEIIEPSTKAEEVSAPSEVLDEDPNVVAAETEAADSNGNAERYQETTDIHRLEIPDIMHRSVSETISNSVLSPWSDGNTQLDSPLSPTTLVEASAHPDLATKIESLLASNGHDHKSVEEAILPSKELDTTAEVDALAPATEET
ncbi:hypothetical protein HYPSUDRAFT_84425 [Hypholoma sublateritium FD-334 SS-4]|uniref:Meiotically up-regulated protein Msb1/Mug8 domain-containing protein n=1 Tax=Hypholoma sublateritium (strain FD-334 SS-4) TaxID=945553 RepID=A0A0D2P6G1_HYPSF|nr:hypothetical protein HYPSUDRAFT_84425 [Hypholoma sublateritium FD-334 SS-4]